MKRSRLLSTTVVCAGALLMLQGAASVGFAETFVGSTNESRVVLAYAADAEATQAQLPDGWSLLTLGKGPFKGANVIVLLFDQHLILDLDGQPEDPATARGIVTVSYGTPDGGGKPRMFVTNVYSTRPEANPYGTAMGTRIARSAQLSGPADGPKQRTEHWQATTEDGSEIALKLAYTVGRPSASSGEAQPYSAVDPEFFRIYRYEQLAELVFSDAMGRPLEGSLSFTTTATPLRDILGEAETPVAAMVLPVYRREIFLP